MKNIVQEIQSDFANHADFFIEKELIDNTTIYFNGFNTLVNLTKSARLKYYTAT